MFYFNIFLHLLCTLLVCESWSDTSTRSFPTTFKFGVATAAYQVEGGDETDGRGENIWDHYISGHPGVVKDGSEGTTAADSYHQTKRDVEMLRELGVDFYRFSVSWARVLPSGYSNEKNEVGFKYYDELIDELTKYNIEPMITMYHFDLPQKLQDLGGWTNPLSVEWFQDYARSLFDRYAHKVPYWITFNQPYTICVEGYGTDAMAPGFSVKGIAEYICTKNVLLAHANVWKIYNEEYRSKYGGMVGVSAAVNWLDPVNNATDNVEAAEEHREFTIGLYLNPIFSKEGDFPALVKKIISKKSAEQGFPRSRLPTLSKDEITLIRGSADYLAMNHYTTNLVGRGVTPAVTVPSFYDDTNVKLTFGKKWKKAKSSWLRSVPYGLYKACLYINKMYNYPQIYITENGWSTDLGLDDDDRITNMREYLNALLLAMNDGTDVKGYAVWSLMDNFEWTSGYSERFGLYEVDFRTKGKNRTARKSAFVYKKIISSRLVDMDWEPATRSMKISDRRLRIKPKVEL